jgi:hypothetical protein
MYLDRLDGRITAEFFDEKSKQWRGGQKQIEARMTQLQTGKLRSAAEAVQIMQAVSDACATFQEKQPHQQRATASALMQEATWKAGKFEWTLKEPYQILAHSNSVSLSKERQKPGSGQEIEIWLPGMDSNHDKLKRPRVCNLQGFQWSKMPDWTRKTLTRTRLVHGRSQAPPHYSIRDRAIESFDSTNCDTARSRRPASYVLVTGSCTRRRRGLRSCTRSCGAVRTVASIPGNGVSGGLAASFMRGLQGGTRTAL